MTSLYPGTAELCTDFVQKYNLFVQIQRFFLLLWKNCSTFAPRMKTGTHIVISTATDLLRIRTTQLLYIQSDGNYSTLFLTGGEMRVVTFQLGQLEKIMASQLPETDNNFVRIGRSLIINLNYVFYINLSKQQLVMADKDQGRYTLNASREALASLKELIENALK